MLPRLLAANVILVILSVGCDKFSPTLAPTYTPAPAYTPFPDYTPLARNTPSSMPSDTSMCHQGGSPKPVCLA